MKYNGPPRYNAPIGYNAADVVEGPQVGWFGDWWQAGAFPPVWFAPADESHLTPTEIQTGGKRRAKIRTYPNWTPAPILAPYVEPEPVENDEALLLCGLI